MYRPRIIPVLLLKEQVLVKSVRFRDHRYIGDPINAVRIFNELTADELVFLDIGASRKGQLISLDFVRDVGEEARMPFAVGGGIRSLEDIRAVVNAGAERVVINTAAENPDFIRAACDAFGSTTIIVCIDVKRQLLRGQRSWFMSGSKSSGHGPVEFAKLMEQCGVGELIVQSIERDGTMDGYDIELTRTISESVRVPVVALGGAGSGEDLVKAYRSGYANGAAAGSLFVYHSRNRGVLINYPQRNELIFD